jgi:DNA sulfur modification protein DndC
MRDEYLADHDWPWIVGYSGGKDSTVVLHLAFEVMLELPPSSRWRDVHVVANDTGVESPLVADYVDAMLGRIGVAADGLRLPVTVVKTTPAPGQTFWVNLIGRGYASPNRSFRWCTDRMKIRPTTDYIKSRVASNGQVILLLGVRRAESRNRATSIERHDSGERLNPHGELAGCMVFRPIVDLTTDEVWDVLLQRRPPWGGTHRELVTLYRNAGGGECPLVISRDQAPSCGTSSARFGCWTCTVVAKDRSMEGLIDAGYEELEPLLDLRDWLAEIRDDRSARQVVRRDGRLKLMDDGSPVPGPFTLEMRRRILDRLLDVQAEVGRVLISDDEVQRIRTIWAEDTAAMALRVAAMAGG